MRIQIRLFLQKRWIYVISNKMVNTIYIWRSLQNRHHISMAWCKTIITPSHLWRSLNSFAQSHRFNHLLITQKFSATMTWTYNVYVKQLLSIHSTRHGQIVYRMVNSVHIELLLEVIWPNKTWTYLLFSIYSLHKRVIIQSLANKTWIYHVPYSI